MTIRSGYGCAYALAAALAVAALLTGCQKDSGSGGGGAGRDSLLVATTVFPIADAVAQVGGERVKVVSLLPTGEKCRGFRPNPALADELAGARLLVVVGLGLDDWARDLVVATGKRAPKVLDLSTAATDGGSSTASAKRGSASGAGPDPFVWLDPLVMVEIIGVIDKTLRELDPAGAAGYANNAARYQAELRDLDRRFAESLKPLAGRPMYTVDVEFGHLAKRYGIRAIPIPLKATRSLRQGHVDEIVQFVRKNRVKYFFAGVYFPVEQLDTVAGKTGAGFDRLDPFGTSDVVGHGNYVDLMKTNMATLVDGLSE